MSKSRKTDISSLFDYSIEVSDKLEKKLSHANKQNKRKKKNRKNKGKRTNKRYNKSDEFEELKKYIFDLYYANTLRQDMLVWAMAYKTPHSVSVGFDETIRGKGIRKDKSFTSIIIVARFKGNKDSRKEIRLLFER